MVGLQGEQAMKYRTYRKRVSRYIHIGQLQISRMKGRTPCLPSLREEEAFVKAHEAYTEAIDFMWTRPKWYGRLQERNRGKR